ncbi:MAG: hypothetical protein P4L99_03185 [Chthoniobacter sp.]|nr:hypothetical protein [Chthoniobacter sp.]
MNDQNPDPALYAATAEIVKSYFEFLSKKETQPNDPFVTQGVNQIQLLIAAVKRSLKNP